MSRDDFWLNSPREWDIGSPFGSVDNDFDLNMNEYPNSPYLDFEQSPLILPQPVVQQPPPPQQPDRKPPVPIQSKHRRTPSMPVNASSLLLGFPPNQFKMPNQNDITPQKMPQPLSIQRNPSVPQPITPSHSRTTSMPDNSVTTFDDTFSNFCADQNIKFNPAKLGFIPSKIWNDEDMTFGEIVSQFFQKKNNANSRFSHKLYNALKITDFDHFYYIILGVEWVSDTVLKVDKKQFARLLGIKTIDGSFFHQQGNFPSHGFVELDPATAQEQLDPKDIQGVDYDNVRLLTHAEGIFRRGCTEEVLESCKWVSTKKRNPA